MRLEFGRDIQQSKEQIIEEYQEWLLACGLRDAIEAASSALEEAHNVLSIWELPGFQPDRLIVRTSVWQKDVVSEGQRFHKRGFPDKLKHMSDHHGIVIEPTMVNHARNINAARNCLVHRAGIVSNADLTSGDFLNVSWRRTSLTLRTDEGDVVPVTIGQTIQGGGMLELRFEDAEKSFRIGERIKFNAQEFADICWTMFIFGVHLGEKMTELGLAKGTLTKPDQLVGQDPNPPDEDPAAQP